VLACIACDCIDIVFCYRFVLGTAQSCVTGCRSGRDLERVRLFIVHGNRHHESRYRSDEARSIECQLQEPTTCFTRVRATVRLYSVYVLTVDSLLTLSECVPCDNGPLTV